MGHWSACAAIKSEHHLTHFLPISSFRPFLAAGMIPKMASDSSLDQDTLVAFAAIPINLISESWLTIFQLALIS